MPELRYDALADADGDQRLVQRDLPRRRAQQVFAAQDVGDAHRRVVDGVRERVEGLAVGTHDDVVGDVLGLERHLAADEIGERDRRVGHPEPDDGFAPLRLVRGALLVAQITVQSVVPARPSLGAGALAALLELLGGVVRVVRETRLDQLARDVAVQVEPLGLPVRPEAATDLGAFVPVQAEPTQRVEQTCVRVFAVACRIGVFDPEHEGAARMTRVRPVEQRSTHIADMQVAGRRGTEANAYVSHGRPPGS